MQRDSKLGYGFLFVGAAMPYLIEHFFGATAALVVTIICAVLGIGFLWAGHVHRGKDDPPITLARKTITTILACSAIFWVCFMGWKVHAQAKTKNEPAASLPAQPPPSGTIIQTAKDSDCSNIVAKDLKLKCEIEKEKKDDKSKP
jgi:hypothetical protein